MAIALLTRSGKNSISWRPRGHAVARELSRNQLPHAFVGRHISVVDEQGIVVFKVPLYSRDP
jgi:hypothetical protein